MEPVREGEKHPLENPDILSVIFKNLPLSDLKSCRQVCQLWAEESSKKMRYCTKVSFGRGSDVKNLASFVDSIRRDERVRGEWPPASIYRLSSGPADNSYFWDLCGAHIRHLSLCNVNFKSVDVFLHPILESSPNLEHLRLKIVSFRDNAMATKHFDEVPPRLLSNTSVKTLSCAGGTALCLERHGVHILEHFPLLQTLHIDSGFGEPGGAHELFRSLARVRKYSPALLDLKTVDIHFGSLPRRSSFRALIDSGLNLECIIVRWHSRTRHGSLGDLEITGQLIEAHAASLQNVFISSNFKSFLGEDGVPLQAKGEAWKRFRNVRLQLPLEFGDHYLPTYDD